METNISATELARKLGDVLGRVRFRGDAFIVERNGRPVAKLSPLASEADGTVRDALSAWSSQAPVDDEFADDLERVNKADRVPRNPWA